MMPPWSSGAQCGMLVVERVAKIRRADFQEQKTIKQICRESSSGLRSWDLRQHEDGGGYDLRRPRPRLQSRSPVPSNRWRSQAHSGRCAGTIWSSRRPLGLNQWRVNEWPCTPASGWDRACVAPSVRARWRRDRSRTRSALSGGGSSCLDRSPRAMPNSMPGARTAVLHGPGRIRTRSCAIARTGGFIWAITLQEEFLSIKTALHSSSPVLSGRAVKSPRITIFRGSSTSACRSPVPGTNLALIRSLGATDTPFNHYTSPRNPCMRITIVNVPANQPRVARSPTFLLIRTHPLAWADRRKRYILSSY